MNRWWSIWVTILALPAYTQDEVVRLKSGKTIVGKIVGRTQDGLQVEKWDGSGVINVVWSQISEPEQQRLKASDSASSSEGTFVDGIRIVTATRTVEGILVKDDDATSVQIKTKDSKSAVQIPRIAILARESVRLSEADIFTPEERLDMKVKAADVTKVPQLVDLANMARSLGFQDRAREFLQKAADLCTGADKDKLLSDIREIDARKALDEIQKMIENAKFEDAANKAQELLQDFEGTELAKKNADILDRIKKESQEFLQNRDRVLGRKVVEQFSKLVDKSIKESASEDKVDTAMRKAEKADLSAVKELKTKFEISDEDFAKWWGAAERDRAATKRHVSLGTGTWIALGGQDGGYDSEDTRQTKGGSGNPLDDLEKHFGQGQNQKKPKEQDFRKKLQTKQEWWESQSHTTRSEFLMALWARQCERLQRDPEKERKCPTCNGTGYLKGQRGIKFVDIVCSRCHNVGKEIDVIFY